MSYRDKKLIITVALTGNVPTKEANPNTPITVDEIVEDIIRCREAGASIAHIHVRDDNGNPTCDREKYKQVLEKLAERKCDIIK